MAVEMQNVYTQPVITSAARRHPSYAGLQSTDEILGCAIL